MAEADIEFDFDAKFDAAKTSMESYLADLRRQGSIIAGIGKTAFATWGISLAITGARMAISQFKEWIGAANESEDVATRLGAAVDKAGKNFQWTAEQLSDAAANLQNKSIFGDEAIKQAQTALIQAKLTGQTFVDAQQTALDLASAMGIDLPQAASTLGRALASPERGLLGLRRVGVQFTQSQEDTVKAMMKVGNIAGAQGVLMGELQKRYKGAAEEMAGTVSGQLTQVSELFGDISEELGNYFMPIVEAVIPVIRTLSITIRDWLAELNENGGLQSWAENTKAIFTGVIAFVETSFDWIGSIWDATVADMEVQGARLKLLFSGFGEEGMKAQYELNQAQQRSNKLNNGPGWSAMLDSNAKKWADAIAKGPEDKGGLEGGAAGALGGAAAALKDAAKETKKSAKDAFTGGFENVEATFQRIQTARVEALTDTVEKRQLNALEKQIEEFGKAGKQNDEQLAALNNIHGTLKGGVPVRLA